MRTSLNEIQAIEAFVEQQLPPQDRLAFEARMLVDKTLREKVEQQRHTYRVIKTYGRKQLRLELESIHTELFTQPRHQYFRQQILSFFKKF